MKRFVLLFAFLLISSAVSAGEWVTEPVRWLETYQGGASGTAIQHRDTLYDVIAAGQTDTTWSFKINRARPFMTRITPATAAADTQVIAWLIFTPDSSVLGVTAPTVSSITVEIDGRAGAYKGNTVNGGWAQIDSVVSAGHSVRGVITVPLKVIGGLANAALTADPYSREYRLLAYPELRARITAATGVMSACRAFIRYYVE